MFYFLSINIFILYVVPPFEMGLIMSLVEVVVIFNVFPCFN